MARQRSQRRSAKKADLLDPKAWIAAALDILADHGMEAVRVEPLAKTLAVTKGSFYWHFKNRRALIDALLAEWRSGRISAIAAQAAAGKSPRETLWGLAHLYKRRANFRGLAIELAIRSFARKDKPAAAAVAAVDRERFRRVQLLFERLGYARSAAQAQAILFYSYLFGQSLIDAGQMKRAVAERAIAKLIASP